MEIVYDESTGTWGEHEEPYTTLDVQTEEDWNKLEFMINNFSRLEEENKELKRLLRLAVEEITKQKLYADLGMMSRGALCKSCKTRSITNRVCQVCNYEYEYAEEALKLIGDDKQ